MAWAIPAAFHMSFLGTQPTLTQVPPSAPSSATAARAPYSAARWAAASPPLPPPMTNKSNSGLSDIWYSREVGPIVNAPATDRARPAAVATRVKILRRSRRARSIHGQSVVERGRLAGFLQDPARARRTGHPDRDREKPGAGRGDSRRRPAPALGQPRHAAGGDGASPRARLGARRPSQCRVQHGGAARGLQRLPADALRFRQRTGTA